jgi:hypothetical protein
MRAHLGQLVPQIATSGQLNDAIAPLVGPTLTSSNVAPALPDITGTLAPAPVACSQWSLLNNLIAQNPVVSVVILSVVFALMYPKGKK